MMKPLPIVIVLGLIQVVLLTLVFVYFYRLTHHGS
jgi:hypothetical protein